jgi:hypothetical protein
MEVLSLVHDDRLVRPILGLCFHELPSVPNDAEPIPQATGLKSLTKLSEHLPELRSLQAGKGSAPPRPRHLEIISLLVDPIRLNDLVPFLGDKAHVPLHRI